MKERTKRIEMRVTPAEKKAVVKMADRQGVTVSDILRKPLHKR